jgi:hypothetical protein
MKEKYNKKYTLQILLLLAIIAVGAVLLSSPRAQASHCQTTGCVCIPQSQNDPATRDHIALQHLETILHFNAEFAAWEAYLINVFFRQHLLPALMYMSNQLVAVSMHQMLSIGMFFDAKHQIATQDLFRKKLIEAHRDYQPSHGMCVFGTSMRSLADASRRTDVTAHVMAQRALERQMGARDVAAAEGPHVDKQSRLEQFRTRYCDVNDNNGELDAVCASGSAPAETINKDINFMSTVDRALTLDIDFTDVGAPSEDEQDIMALASNLYSHDVFFRIPEAAFIVGSRDLSPYRDELLDLRSIVAKRSVAENSYNRIVALRSMGSPDPATGPLNSESSATYMRLIFQELGIPDAEISELLGGVPNGDPLRPSYYAQMDLLTKKILQNPSFFVDLYDKPANVERKSATLQAIKNMQDFDTLESALRTEAMLSVLLETKLMDEQKAAQNRQNLMDMDGTEN